MGSHLWAALFPLHQHSPCHLFCCWNGQQTGRSDSISYILRLMYRTECDSARRNEEGQGLTVGTSGCGVLQLSALCSSFALSSLTTTFRECFLALFIVKTHTPWPRNCTLTEYSSIQLSLRILMWLSSTLVDLYYFYLRALFSLIELKLQRKVRSIGEAPAGGFTYPFNTLRRGDALHSASCCTQRLSPLH